MSQKDGPVCPYCRQPAKLVFGDIIYPRRHDLHEKLFYQCVPCDAYVGCHPGTSQPLGRLANDELRRAKIAAHAAFDPLWRNGKMKRSDAYVLLAKKLNMSTNECHIGMFDVPDCKRVIDACKEMRNVC